ncbi:MAG: thioredoxin family protein [Butyrivibrio sp.]
MGLFGFGKKKEEETKKGCCCKGTTNGEPVNEGKCTCGGNGCHIKILGAGCKSCNELHENVKKAVADMNLDAEVLYITDMEKVMSYGVMSMPAIVVNEQVVSMGKVLKVSEVGELLKKLGC